MSRKIGVPRTRQKSSGEVREAGAAARRTGHVLLLDLPVESAFQPPSDIVEVDDTVRVLLEIPGVPAGVRAGPGAGEPDRGHRGEGPGFSRGGDLFPLSGTDLREDSSGPLK